MPSSKEIEIILQAKLDQGNAIDSAKSLGVGISDAIEQAFNGLGERIAANLVLQIQRTISSMRMDTLVGTNDTQIIQGLKQSATSREIVDTSGYTQGSNGLWTRPGSGFGGGIQSDSSQPAPPSTAPSPPIGAGGEAAAAASRSDRNFSYSARRFGLGFSEGFMGINNPLAEDFNAVLGSKEYANNRKAYGLQESLNMDALAVQLQGFKAARKVDPSLRMDDDFKQNLTDLRKFSVEQIGSNNQASSELVSKISELTKEMKESAETYRELKLKDRQNLTEEQKTFVDTYEKEHEKRGDKLDLAVQELDKKRNQNRSIVSTVNDIDAELNEERNGRQATFNRFAKGTMAVAGIAGAVGEFANNYSLMQSRSGAATAQLENSGVRDYLSGNMDSLIAAERLGGQEKLIKESREEAANSWYIKMGLSGLALGTGVGMSMTGGGAVAGIPIAAAGAASMANLVERGMYLDKDALARKSEKEQNEIAQNQEKYMALRAGREQAIQSYRTAQALGASDISGDLMGLTAYGVSDGSGLTSNLRKDAIDAGLTNSGFDAFMGNVYGTMGGYFQDSGNAMSSVGVKRELARGLRYKGEGFSNYESVSSGLFNQNMAGSGDASVDRASAFKESADLFQRAFESGMDKMKIGQYLEQIVSRMNSRGYGSEYMEKGLGMRAIELSKQLYGTAEGKQVQATNDILQNIYGASKGTDTLSVIARAQTFNQLEGQGDEFKKITQALRNSPGMMEAVGTLAGSPKDFAKMIKLNRPDLEIDDKMLEDYYKQYTQKDVSNRIKLEKINFGQDNAGAVFNMTDPKTIAQLNAATETMKKVEAGDIIAGAYNLKGEGTEGKEGPLGKDLSQITEQGQYMLLNAGASELKTSFETLSRVVDGIASKLSNLASNPFSALFGGGSEATTATTAGGKGPAVDVSSAFTSGRAANASDGFYQYWTQQNATQAPQAQVPVWQQNSSPAPGIGSNVSLPITKPK